VLAAWFAVIVEVPAPTIFALDPLIATTFGSLDAKVTAPGEADVGAISAISGSPATRRRLTIGVSVGVP